MFEENKKLHYILRIEEQTFFFLTKFNQIEYYEHTQCVCLHLFFGFSSFPPTQQEKKTLNQITSRRKRRRRRKREKMIFPVCCCSTCVQFAIYLRYAFLCDFRVLRLKHVMQLLSLRPI